VENHFDEMTVIDGKFGGARLPKTNEFFGSQGSRAMQLLTGVA